MYWLRADIAFISFLEPQKHHHSNVTCYAFELMTAVSSKLKSKMEMLRKL
jgi:hypothetical protein